MFSTLFAIHFVSGGIGLLAGFLVIVFSKGNKLHVRLGQAYLIAMLLLGGTGTIIAFVMNIPLSMINGLVICYFILSSVSAIRNPAHKMSVFDKILTVCAWLIVFGFINYITEISNSESGQLGGFGIEAYIAFGSVMLVGAIGDVRYLLKSGLSNKQKLIRHIWRMFFPLFMATAAFFLGQAKQLPKMMQSIEIVIIPVAFVIIAMFYWAAKVAMNKVRL